MLRMLDLFSGIGGFSLAAQWTGRIETAAFCEIDPFCQEVLRKHWPDVPVFDDIRALTGKELDGLGRIDLLTGGFPCQPFSHAGKRLGAADDRHLWPEMARVIAESRPRWVVGENTPGLIGLALDDCLLDLESLGYEAWTVVLPACAVNAPHRRDRVWILAHAERESKPEPGHEAEAERVERNARLVLGGCGDRRGLGAAGAAVADADAERQPQPEGRVAHLRRRAGDRREQDDAGQTLGGVDAGPDGLPARLVRPRWGGDPLTAWDAGWEDDLSRTTAHEPDRVNKLKAAGNSIVPQVAFVILKELVRIDAEEAAG